MWSLVFTLVGGCLLAVWGWSWRILGRVGSRLFVANVCEVEAWRSCTVYILRFHKKNPAARIIMSPLERYRDRKCRNS